MTKTTVADDKRLDKVEEVMQHVMDKIEEVLERQIADGNLLRKHIEEEKDLREWMGNGFTKDVGRIAGEVAADVVETRFKEHAEKERESYIKKLEDTVRAQTSENRSYGTQRDLEQKRQANRTKLWVAVVSAAAVIMVAVIQVFGG